MKGTMKVWLALLAVGYVLGWAVVLAGSMVEGLVAGLPLLGDLSSALGLPQIALAVLYALMGYFGINATVEKTAKGVV